MIILLMMKLCPLHLQDLNLEVIKEETGFIQQLDMIEPKSRNTSVYKMSLDLASIVSKTCNPPLEVQSPQHFLYGGSEAGMAGFEDVSIVEDD